MEYERKSKWSEGWYAQWMSVNLVIAVNKYAPN